MTTSANTQVLNQVTQDFITAISGSAHTIFTAGESLFAGLLVMQIAWSGLKMAIKSDRVEELQGEMLWQILIMSIFYFIVLSSNILIPQVINIFTRIAKAAQPIAGLDPSTVAGQGLSIAGSIYNSFGLAGFLTDLPNGIIIIAATLAVSILFGLIAIDLMIVLIMNYFQIALAPIFFAFGAFEYVRDIAHSYLKSSLALAIKLFVLYLVIGIGQSIASSWGAEAATAAKNGDIMATIAILVGAIAFWKLATTLPGHFAGIVHSSMSGSGSMGAAMVAGAIAGGGTAAAVASGGMGAVAGTAGAAIKTSVAGSRMASLAASHSASGSGFMSSVGKAAAGSFKSGVDAVKQNAIKDSQFLQNLADKRDMVRPPQEAEPKPSSPKSP